ncbi:MAG: ABC transporter permease subunit, partial [Actinomycetota bacterium]|nr:ABC transporter permease subunit [Actinomycetota bacterium]
LGVLTWWAVRGAARPDLGEMAGAVIRTSGVSVLAAVAAVAVVLPVAVLTERHRGRLAEVPNALVIGGFALPGIVIAFALGRLALALPEALGFLYQSLPLLVLAYVVHFGAQALRAGQVAVGGLPRRMGDAARMLGAGRVRRLATVELPLMGPGLVSGAGLVLLSTMKELPATLLLAPTAFDTLATRIWGAHQAWFLAETGFTSLVLVALAGTLTWVLILRRA